MKPARHPKIRTFDGPGFWSDAYANQRGALLRLAGVPEESIPDLVNMRYLDLPADIRYDIEAGGISKKDLAGA